MKTTIAMTIALGLFFSGATKVVGQPDISVTPDSLDASLFTGTKAHRTLTIKNLGASDLTWSLETKSAATASKAITPPWSPLGNVLTDGGSAPAMGQSPSSLRQGADRLHNERPIVSTSPAGAASGTPILVIQNYFAWGVDMGSFISTNFGITPTVINSGQIASTDFSPFDIVITVGDQDPGYYSQISANVAKFESFAAAGGIVQYQLATQGDNVGIVNGVSVLFGNMELTNRVVSPGHPIVAGLPAVLHGNWANHCYLSNLPANAEIITVTDASNVPTTAEYAYGNGRVIATGMTWEYLNINNYDAGPMLYNALAYSLSLASVSWLAANPSSGTIPAGSSKDIDVTLDATGLNGGDYLAVLLVKSNDPDEPQVRVPAHLHVTGAPDITVSPDSINFGSVFVGFPLTDTVLVKNIGTDLLHVTGISSNNSNFVPGTAGFTLNPGAQIKVPVTFTPSVPSPIGGILTFISNDPDTPSATVVLKGQGLIPPDVSVSPDSLDADLFTGSKENQTLTIKNLGGSGLFWTLDINPVDVLKTANFSLAVPLNRPNPGAVDQNSWNQSGIDVPLRTTIIQATLLDLTGVHILFDQAHGNNSGGNWSAMISDLQSRGATVTYNYSLITSAVLQDIDIFWLTDVYGSPLAASEVTALHNWLIAGGGLLIEGDETIESYNALLTSVGAGIVYMSQSPASGVTTAIFPHETTVGVDSIYIDYPLARLSPVTAPAAVLVKDIGGGNNVAYSKFGNGRIIAMADENFGNWSIGAVDNELFGNQVFDWLAKAVGFVSVDIEGGTVPSVDSTRVTVTFDATGLNGGDYLADLLVRSNDPDQPQVRVPAHLHVTGAPDIAVSPDSINFGSIFIGYSSTDTLVVKNIGTDLLNVTGTSSNHSNFVPGTAGFTLIPGAQISVPVTFTPSVSGPIVGLLTFTSNDPDLPSATVVLKGQGLIPPVIHVGVDSMDQHLFSGDTAVRSFAISNTGGSNLSFSIEAISATPPSPLSSPNPERSSVLNGPRMVTSGDRKAGFIPNIISVSQDPAAPTWQELALSGAPITGLTFPRPNSPTTSSQSATGTVIISDPAGDASGYTPLVDIISVKGEIRLDSAWFELIFATPLDPSNFGGYFSIDIDQNPLTGHAPTYGLPTQNIGAEFEVYLFYIDQGYVLLHNFSSTLGAFPVILGSHSVKFGLPLSALGGDDGSMDVTGVIGNNDGPTDWFPDHGHGTLVGMSWLTCAPTEGVVPSGGNIVIKAIFDARGLFGGDYYANVLIHNNDSLHPEIRIPVHLGVTGVPDIATVPDSLTFGTVFVGTSHRDTVFVSNRGTDLLTVSNIAVGNAHFSAGPISFSLAPDDNLPVEVIFTPGIEGDLSTILSIASNDPDEAVIHLPLHGRGLFPPEIHVNPDSLSADIILAIDPKKKDTLTISNSGRSDLIWTTQLQAGRRDSALFTLNLTTRSGSSRLPNEPGQTTGPRPPARTTPLQAVLKDLTGVSIVLDASHGAYGDLSYFSTIVADLRNRGAVVTMNYATITSALLADVDIVWLIDHTYSWSPEELGPLHDWMMAGGGLLLEGDETETIFNTILASLGAGITYTSQSPASGVTTDIFPHETTVGVHSLYLEYPLARLSTVTAPAAVLVRDIGGGNNVAYSTVGSGRIIAMADENSYDGVINSTDNQLFANQRFDWLASRLDWLTIAPTGDTAPAGMTNSIEVTIDGSKPRAGYHRAIIAVQSNDPFAPVREVPVTLHVREYLCGDANADGIVNRADLNYIVDYYFHYGPAPSPFGSGDLNCDNWVNLSDICSLERFLNGNRILNCCQK